jgi:hypothetical protein
MHRQLAVLVAALLVAAAVVGGVASASHKRVLDNCSNNNGFVACKYVDQGSIPANQGRLGSAYDYWVTSSMWRPSSRCARVGFNNSAGDHFGSIDCSSDTHFSYYGPFGYSRGVCENDTGSTLSNVTCEVFNWTV